MPIQGLQELLIVLLLLWFLLFQLVERQIKCILSKLYIRTTVKTVHVSHKRERERKRKKNQSSVTPKPLGSFHSDAHPLINMMRLLRATSERLLQLHRPLVPPPPGCGRCCGPVDSRGGDVEQEETPAYGSSLELAVCWTTSEAMG